MIPSETVVIYLVTGILVLFSAIFGDYL